MMKCKQFSLSFFIIASYSMYITSAQHLPTPYVITFFFKPPCHNEDILQNIFETPCRLLQERIQQNLIQGIYVLYRGLATTSDFNGQISFPQRFPTGTFTVIITDGIYPVFLFGNTVHHLEIAEDHPLEVYQYTLEKPLWKISKQSLPDRHIPPDALIIFAKPDQVKLLETDLPLEQGPNIFLPPVYVTDKITLSENALQFLKISKFFTPVLKVFSYANKRYASIITN